MYMLVDGMFCLELYDLSLFSNDHELLRSTNCFGLVEGRQQPCSL